MSSVIFPRASFCPKRFWLEGFRGAHQRRSILHTRILTGSSTLPSHSPWCSHSQATMRAQIQDTPYPPRSQKPIARAGTSLPRVPSCGTSALCLLHSQTAHLPALFTSAFTSIYLFIGIMSLSRRCTPYSHASSFVKLHAPCVKQPQPLPPSLPSLSSCHYRQV